MKDLLERQRTAFARNPPRYRERLDALRALERALIARQDDFAAAVSRDFTGRPAEESFALELFPLLNEIRHACRNLKQWMAPQNAAVRWPFWPASARIVHRPLGVVGILSAWNYPIFLSLAPLTGALAAGNHALLKPSELAPSTAELLRSVLSELFSPDYVSVVTGGPDTADEFIRLQFDHLLFTGSTRVGRLVMKAAAENLVPVTLELGGKCPALIHPTYPIERAAQRILTAKLFNAGQTCIAPDYVLVHEERRDEFVRVAQQLAARMYPTLADNRDYTRIINTPHYRRLSGLVDDARGRGGGVVEIKGPTDVCDETNHVFAPTLVTNVHGDMAIMQEEIFGPVLPVVEYRSIDEAIAFVNARPHPLALYYFDADATRVDEILARVPAGGVTVCDCIYHVGQAALPFGGVGHSGMGRYHGYGGFQTFSNRQGVFIQRRWAPLGLMRPPYHQALTRVLRFLLRHG